MLGQPKFKREDRVSFTFSVNGEEKLIDGVIYIVDEYGTFEQSEEVSYDIEAVWNGGVALFKHIRESRVIERK